MKAIYGRLRRLENAGAPADLEKEAAQAILDARRRRLGTAYEPVPFPSETDVDRCAIADRILCTRKLVKERAIAAEGAGIRNWRPIMADIRRGC
jgi:hypothetical protein